MSLLANPSPPLPGSSPASTRPRYHQFRRWLLLLGLACALPLTARAQGTLQYTEHDWRIMLNGSCYGLVQEYLATLDTGTETRTTTICWGPHAFRTSLPAAWLVVMALLVSGVSYPLLAGKLAIHKDEL